MAYAPIPAARSTIHIVMLLTPPPPIRKLITRSPSIVTIAHGSVRVAPRPVRSAQVARTSASAQVGAHAVAWTASVADGAPGAGIDDVVQAVAPRPRHDGRRRQRALHEGHAGCERTGVGGVLDRHLDRRCVAGDREVSARAHERPGQSRPPTAASAARSAVNPFAMPPMSSPTPAGSPIAPGQRLDLAPTAAGPARVKRTPRARQHLVVVAVVAGGDDRIQHGRDRRARRWSLRGRWPVGPTPRTAATPRPIRPPAGSRA